MPLFGYGKILDIDLSSSRLLKREISSNFAKGYLGGMGFGCKIFYDEVKSGINPLGSENIVIFAVGPLTGTTAPCSGRFEVTNLSPLNNNIGTGNSGGVWGAYLKFAGYDIVIVRNMAVKPVYLLIDDDVVELRDAKHLWGLDTKTTTDIITQELGSNASNVSVLTIGPAGENLVNFACTVNDYHHVAARGGAGAVLGSKKLKAIAVRRSKKKIKVAKREKFNEAVKEARGRLNVALRVTSIKDVPKKFGFIMDSDVRAINIARGCLPAKNFQTGFLPQWLEKMGQDFSLKYIKRKESTCYACPMSCFDLVEVNEGKYAGTKVTRGNAPGMMMDIGAKCALDNPFAVWKCKELCHNLGLDYASACGVIAFAQELFQREIINTGDTNGLELNWGNEDAVIEMIYRISKREGFGNILAEGSVKAAKVIGKEAEKYVMCIKGLEAMSADPRSSKRGWSFGEITNPRGGDNVKSTHFRADTYNPNWTYENYDIFGIEKERMYNVPLSKIADTWSGKPIMTKWFEDLYTLCNSLVVCFFPAGFQLALGPTYYSKMYSACTGWDTTPQEMMQLGEKLFNLLKACTVREGFNRKDDCWAERFYIEPMPEGAAKGSMLSREKMDRLLDEYYYEREWNRELGVPTVKKLRALDLNDIAADLLIRGKIPRE